MDDDEFDIWEQDFWDTMCNDEHPLYKEFHGIEEPDEPDEDCDDGKDGYYILLPDDANTNSTMPTPPAAPAQPQLSRAELVEGWLTGCIFPIVVTIVVLIWTLRGCPT